MQSKFSHLTDDQWQAIKVFLNREIKRKHILREIVNAILWMTRTGTQRRSFASEYPLKISLLLS